MDLPTGDLPKKLLSNMSYKVIVNVNVSSLLYVNKSVKQETDDSSLNSSFLLPLFLSLSLSLSLMLFFYPYYQYILALVRLTLFKELYYSLNSNPIKTKMANVCIPTLLNILILELLNSFELFNHSILHVKIFLDYN